MREIKFRGMHINGGWLYGLLSISQGIGSQPPKGSYISNRVGMPWAYQVRPETVGQLIGLHDRNGKEIYEGDIVSANMHYFEEEDKPIIRAIGWWEPTLQWAIIHPDGFDRLTDIEAEVIGNIYENPGLLEGTK